MNDESMRILKQVLGVIGLILGVLGVLLAIAQLVGIWVVNPPVKQGLQDLTARLQEGLQVAEQALTQSAATAEEVRIRLAARPEEAQPQLVRLEASMARVQSTLDYAGQTIQTLQSMLDTTGRIARIGGNPEQTGVSEKLDQAAQTVDSASQKLAELADLLASLAQRGAQSLDQIEARLQEVETQLNALAARMSEAQAQLAAIENSIPTWINRGTVALTVIFLWYGIAQVCLLVLSWRWVRQPGNGAAGSA